MKKEEYPTFEPLDEAIVEPVVPVIDNTQVIPIDEPIKKIEDPKIVGPVEKFEPLKLIKSEEDLEEEEEEEEEFEISTEEAIENIEKAFALGTLIAPDEEGWEYDGSEEATQKIYEHTLKVQEERARQSLFSKMKDPYLQELVSYGMEAGEFANLKEFGTSLREHYDANSVDVNDVEQAKDIVTRHLLAKGNTKKYIDKMIEIAIEDDELSDMAIESKQYFITEAEDKVLAQKEADREANKQYVQYQRQFEQTFLKALQDKQITNADRVAISSSLNEVELQNGTKIPEYQYKINQIKSNPTDFIDLLQILNTYNPGKGFNFETSKQAKTEKIKSIYEVLNSSKPTVVKSASQENINNGKRKKFVQSWNRTENTI